MHRGRNSLWRKFRWIEFFWVFHQYSQRFPKIFFLKEKYDLHRSRIGLKIKHENPCFKCYQEGLSPPILYSIMRAIGISLRRRKTTTRIKIRGCFRHHMRLGWAWNDRWDARLRLCLSGFTKWKTQPLWLRSSTAHNSRKKQCNIYNKVSRDIVGFNIKLVRYYI